MEQIKQKWTFTSVKWHSSLHVDINHDIFSFLKATYSLNIALASYQNTFYKLIKRIKSLNMSSKPK